MAFIRGGSTARMLLVFIAILFLPSLLAAVCGMAAAALWRRRRSLALILLAVGAAPLVHYAFDLLRAQGEPERRSQEIAAWHRAPLLPRSGPAMEVVGGLVALGREVQVLVATGVAPDIFARQGDRTYVIERTVGWECLTDETSGGVQAELRRVVLARQAFRVCGTMEQHDDPPQATVRLYTGRTAPNHYRGPGCMDRLHAVLELRWHPRYGGGLVDFQEPAIRRSYLFPPVLALYPPGRIWACQHQPVDPEAYDAELRGLDGFRFLAAAFGYRFVDDFPRGDARHVPEALQRLIPHLGSAFAHDHILALMGQWPAMAATDALIGAGPIAEQARHRILLEAARLLGDPRHFDRQQRLYPHLHSHAPALLKACAVHGGRWETGPPCAVIAKAAAGVVQERRLSKPAL